MRSVNKNQVINSDNFIFLILFSFNLIFTLINSEVLRKINSKNIVVVIIRIKFAFNPILFNSKPITVGKEIIKKDKTAKLYIVNFLIHSRLK